MAINLNEFIKLSGAKSLTEISLTIAFYAERHLGTEWFITNELRGWLIEARIPPPANLHDVISKANANGLLIPDKNNTPIRYKLSQEGINRVEKQLEKSGLLKDQDEEVVLLNDISKTLSENIEKIPDVDERGYIQEALSCLNPKIKAYRAAIIMGWTGAMFHLRKKVEKQGFSLFIQAFSELSLGKSKPINSIDDLENYSDNDFLTIITRMGIIDKGIKKQLENCLDLRNSCGHPTQVYPQINRVKAYFEDIIQYVFVK